MLCTALEESDGQTMDRVASLIDKSLLQQIEQEGQEPRLLMLETIREYGLERLRDNGELEATLQALAIQDQTIVSTPHQVERSSALPMKPAAVYPDGLTAREVEVLRLVAQGLTDAQIAEQLVISPRTVNNHLTAIYSKIQVSSRAAATRYAMEHQLV
jgi:DNA-binding NarL/FixJ family response regulator